MNIKSTPEYKQGIKDVEKLIDAKINPLLKKIAALEKALAALQAQPKA